MAQFAGDVIVSTNVTASPSPIDVSTFLEIARKEHIPRKYANRMFSTNTALVKMLYDLGVEEEMIDYDKFG